MTISSFSSSDHPSPRIDPFSHYRSQSPEITWVMRSRSNLRLSVESIFPNSYRHPHVTWQYLVPGTNGVFLHRDTKLPRSAESISRKTRVEKTYCSSVWSASYDIILQLKILVKNGIIELYFPVVTISHLLPVCRGI